MKNSKLLLLLLLLPACKSTPTPPLPVGVRTPIVSSPKVASQQAAPTAKPQVQAVVVFQQPIVKSIAATWPPQSSNSVAFFDYKYLFGGGNTNWTTFFSVNLPWFQEETITVNFTNYSGLPVFFRAGTK